MKLSIRANLIFTANLQSLVSVLADPLKGYVAIALTSKNAKSLGLAGQDGWIVVKSVTQLQAELLNLKGQWTFQDNLLKTNIFGYPLTVQVLEWPILPSLSLKSNLTDYAVGPAFWKSMIHNPISPITQIIAAEALAEGFPS